MHRRFRELAGAMRTTGRLSRDLHRARRTILGVDWFFGWMSKLIDDADDKKYRGRNNQEVDHESDEIAVVPGDRAECRADDYANRKIDSVPFDCERFEFRPDFFHTTILTSFLGTTITLRTAFPAIRS